MQAQAEAVAAWVVAVVVSNGDRLERFKNVFSCPGIAIPGLFAFLQETLELNCRSLQTAEFRDALFGQANHRQKLRLVESGFLA
jgi:hypothetical protein